MKESIDFVLDSVSTECDFLEREIRDFKDFKIIENFAKISSDLKEFIAYEVGKLRKNNNENIYDIDELDILRKENSFLKKEIENLKELMKDLINNVFNNVFNNISNTQATKFTDEKTEKKAEWKRVNNCPPGKLKIDSNVIKCSNRYDDLHIDNDYAAVNSADNKNYQDDVDQSVINLNI